jgi:hypothetical protein
MPPITTHERYAEARNWIRFLRGYGPLPRNENMYDEFIRRSAKRLGVEPLDFEHPERESVLKAVCGPAPTSVVLTGTAGDGKTYLCRQVWEELGADPIAWHSKAPLLTTTIPAPTTVGSPSGSNGKSDQAPRARTLHVIRDLSAWAPQRGAAWDPVREELLQRFCASLFDNAASDEIFLIAANDGQLIEAWHRLRPSHSVRRAREVLETLLVDDTQSLDGIALRFFNLSRRSSADLFDRAVGALLAHPGWEACRALNAGPGEFFGPNCPIRRNSELLATPLVRTRLRALLALCDYNRVHVPIRQILLLLANAILGHMDARNELLTAEDVPRIVREGNVGRASLYNNLFGGNLPDTRREARLVFDALDRFGIGYETSNRIDNILIFGDADESLQPYFDRFVGSDQFYGADAAFRAAQREYVEGADENEERSAAFLQQLVSQRRGLFFKIPEGEAEELRLWELTVFSFAGEYLERVIGRLASGGRVERPILSRLVRGLNRVFTGLLVSDDRELLLATSLTVSEGRVSRLLEDRISVEPRRGDRLDVTLRPDAPNSVPSLVVTIGGAPQCTLPLHLTRYEFLSRVAEGALPSSFSKECYEDMLAFKSRLLATLAESRAASGLEDNALTFQVIDVDEGGKAAVTDLEVRDV